MKEKFKFDNILIEDIISSFMDKTLQIPRIQRDLVWPKEKKIELQKTIQKGFPFGVILISEIDGVQYVIDGLQRTTTIVEIFKNIFRNMDKKTLQGYIIKSYNESLSLDNTVSFLSEKETVNFLTEKLGLFSPLIKNNENSGTNFADNFTKEYNKEIKKENMNIFILKDILTKIYNHASEGLQINKYKIPIIYFSGTHKETADLFELINTQGEKLKSADVWRSVWSTMKMDFNDEDILSIIKKNTKDDLEYLSIKSEEIKSISPFDIIWYIFNETLSCNWNSHFSLIFSKKNKTESSKKINDLTPLVTLIKVFISFKTNAEDFSDVDIGKKIVELIKSKEDVKEIISNLKKSISIFDKIFNPFKNFRGNKNDINSYSYLPKKSYAIAFVGSIYKKIMEDKDIDIDKFSDENRVSYIKHYIYETLNDAYKSSSSKIAFEYIESNKYNTQIDYITIKIAIESFFQETKNRDTFDFKSELIMSKIFMDNITIKENTDTFNYDHFIPKSKLLEKDIQGISSFANLSLIKKITNSEKSNKIEKESIEDDIVYLWAKKNGNSDALKKSFLKIIEEINQENYDDFLKCRKEIILDMYKDIK